MENTKTKKKESQYSLDTKLKSPLFKIVLVGDSDVGKTSIIQTFINNSFPKQRSKKSVGINFTLKEMKLKNLNVRLEIWDTAGNEKLRTMIGSYYRGAQGIILVFDYNNVKSFYSVKNWLREIKQFASEDTIKYLVCNKYDLRNSTIQFNKNLVGDLGPFDGLSETNKTFNNHSLILPSNLNTMNNTNNQTLNNIVLTNPNLTANNINNLNLNNNSNYNNNYNYNNNNLNSIVVSSKNSIVPLTDEEIEKFAKQNSMKFFKISASLNQGITELFENITRDIIHKMNDEDLINRSRSIKLGYNNGSMYKADEDLGKEWNYYNTEEKKGFLRNRNGNYNNKETQDFNTNNNNKKDYSHCEDGDGKNDINSNYFNTKFSGCCKII